MLLFNKTLCITHINFVNLLTQAHGVHACIAVNHSNGKCIIKVVLIDKNKFPTTKINHLHSSGTPKSLPALKLHVRPYCMFW